VQTTSGGPSVGSGLTEQWNSNSSKYLNEHNSFGIIQAIVNLPGISIALFYAIMLFTVCYFSAMTISFVRSGGKDYRY
jgi:hypothetical protein